MLIFLSRLLFRVLKLCNSNIPSRVYWVRIRKFSFNTTELLTLLVRYKDCSDMVTACSSWGCRRYLVQQKIYLWNDGSIDNTEIQPNTGLLDQAENKRRNVSYGLFLS